MHLGFGSRALWDQQNVAVIEFAATISSSFSLQFNKKRLKNMNLLKVNASAMTKLP